MGTIAIRLTYAIMIIGVIFCYLFSKNHQHDIRDSVNEFADAFSRLSNFLMKTPPKESLRTKTEGDKLVVLPVDSQPDQIKAIIRRVSSPKTMEMFSQLDDAAEHVSKRAGINRTHKSQFQAPVDELLVLTQEFLEDCNDLTRIDSEEKLKRFESYIFEQPQHRMVLLKRISGSYGDAYRELNTEYAAEMEAIEAAEIEQKKRGSKPQKAADEKKNDARQETADKQKEERQQGTVNCKNDEQETEGVQDIEKPQEEECLRDKWSGYGCG